MKTRHVPVLVDEVLEMLRAAEGGHFLDCTLGGGGHTEAILSAHPENTVVACDRDETALERAFERLRGVEDRVELEKCAFSDLETVQEKSPFDGVLADLGLSTDQILEGRGFSFLDEHSLDMRMDSSAGRSVSELIDDCSLGELTTILRRGGVGKLSRRYAEAILRARGERHSGSNLSAKELAELIEAATPQKLRKDSHPATVVFQALRIEVNEELSEIDSLLERAPWLTAPGGRIAVISFHSLEDKKVAGAFRKWQRGDDAPAWWPKPEGGAAPLGKHLTPKAIVPSESEKEQNRSSRSARMRVFEFFNRSGGS